MQSIKYELHIGLMRNTNDDIIPYTFAWLTNQKHYFFLIGKSLTLGRPAGFESTTSLSTMLLQGEVPFELDFISISNQ